MVAEQQSTNPGPISFPSHIGGLDISTAYSIPNLEMPEHQIDLGQVAMGPCPPLGHHLAHPGDDGGGVDLQLGDLTYASLVQNWHGRTYLSEEEPSLLAGADEWAFQGVDAAFFDAILQAEPASGAVEVGSDNGGSSNVL